MKSNRHKLPDLLQLNAVVTMWKFKNRLVPIGSCCGTCKLIADVNNRRKQGFYLPFAKTSLRQRRFVFTGVKMWNSLKLFVKLQRLYTKCVFENYKLFQNM